MLRAMFRDRGILGSFSLLGCSVAILSVGLTLLAISKGEIEAAAWLLIVFGLFIGLVSGIAFVLLMADLMRKRSSSLRILDDWYCYYWPQERRVRLSVPLDIDSEADTCKVTCIAQFGQFKVPLSLIRSGLGKSPFLAERYVPEFEASDVDVPDDVSMALVESKIRLSDGVSKESLRSISIQVVSR